MEGLMEETKDQQLALETIKDGLPAHVQGRVDYSLEAAESALAKHVRLLDLIKRYAVKVTRPLDWMDMAGDGSSVMLQGIGAERLLSRLPLTWTMQITSNMREDYGPQDEIPYAYIVTGDISVQIPGFPPIELRGIQAARGANKFFRLKAEQQKTLIDPLDIRASAETAWKRRAVSIVLGLRGMNREDLAQIAGEEFAKNIKQVPRRQDASRGRTWTEVGKETDAEMQGASDAHKSVWKRLQAITKAREEWALLLAAVTHDPSGKYPDKRSVLQLTDKAAHWVVGQLEALGEEKIRDILMGGEHTDEHN